MASRDFSRAERVAGELRRELARLVQLEVKDPAVGFVSISDVEVSRDLSHARVFVTVFDPEQAKASLRALNRAAGFLRRRLGQEMRIRSVPELSFRHDDSVETGQRMDRLIDEAVSADGAGGPANAVVDDAVNDAADDRGGDAAGNERAERRTGPDAGPED